MIGRTGSVFVELWTGAPDELGEEFATRRDFIVAIDREDMIVDSSFADFELEGDLFFGIACDQAIENLQSAVGERTERWLIGGGKIGPDLVVDGHMDKRDDALFAWGEVARAYAFVQPEGCASSRNIGWADGDDVVIDATLAMDFVVGVRTIPSVFSPDLISGEDHCLAGEFGEVRIFGCAFDGDRLGVFSPAGFCLVGDPSCTVNAQEVGFGVAGHAEVFDLGVDDDLCADELAEGGEEIVSPSVNAGTKIAALACDLVALVNIFCGQIGEHWESPSEPWDGSLMVSVPEICSESQDDLWVLWGEVWLSVEPWGPFVDVRAGELGVCSVFIECGDRAVGVDDVAEIFEGGCFNMAIAEGGVGFFSMASIGSRAVFGESISSIGVIGVVGHQGWIEGVPMTTHSVEVCVSGAVVSVLGSECFGFARSSAHRIGKHDGRRSVDGGCTDRKIDQASGFGIVDKAGIAEEKMVVAIGVVAGVVPFGNGWAEEDLRTINSAGMFVGLLDAGIGEGIEAGCCSDDGEPSGAVLGAVAQGIDIAGFIGVSSRLGGDGDISVGVGVELPTCRDLSHVGATDEGCCGLLCSSECGEQDANQHRDDGNHDQQLDEREGISLLRDSGYSDRTIHRSHCSHSKRRSLHKHGKSSTHERLTMPIQCMVPCAQSVIGPSGIGILEAA